MNRSRSLRKPASTDRDPKHSNPSPEPRTLSPSRLPIKPSSLHRAPSTTTRPPPRPKDGESRYPPSSSRVASAVHAPTGGVARARARTTTGTTTRTGTGTNVGAGTGHARTKSSATALTGATTLRPPSQGSSTRTRSTTTGTATTATTATAGTAGTARSGPGHKRTTSSSGLTRTTSTSASHTRTTSHTRTASTSTTTSTAAQRLKPAFTTLQQHYSPAKNLAPKPLTSTFLAPPSPSKLPSNIALSADTLRLQNELLRLHVLHRSAGSTLAEWEVSAYERLSERFGRLAGVAGDVGAQEGERLGRVNVAALQRWSSSASGLNGAALEAKLQVLDPLLTALWALTEPSGKYTRLMRKFEKWTANAAEMHSSRARGHVLLDDDDEPILLPELDPAWRDECAFLYRKLESWRSQLRDLGDVPPPSPPSPPPQPSNRERKGLVGVQVTTTRQRTVLSSLERMLEACHVLVEGMLEELRVAGEIERMLVEREREWVRGVVLGVGEEGEKGVGAGAIWRGL